MNAELPDITLSGAAPAHSPLAWVGMQGIDLPVPVREPGCHRDVHARIDAQVDLPRPEAKGIHMSRLYSLLDTLSVGEGLTPASLRRLLDRMIESHDDCGSTNARLRVAFDLLVRRPALLTEGLSGWTSYPVRIDASRIEATYSCRLEVRIGYSSTCPCSSALSRQVVEQGFRRAFSGKATVSSEEVAAWLSENATAATPHSQRSEALVSIESDTSADRFDVLALIDRVEGALQTPLQTAVKRADEQAFAVLNGSNLMFVEDAARRIDAVLAEQRRPLVHVRHLESLHPHDAVAWTQQDASPFWRRAEAAA